MCVITSQTDQYNRITQPPEYQASEMLYETIAVKPASRLTLEHKCTKCSRERKIKLGRCETRKSRSWCLFIRLIHARSLHSSMLACITQGKPACRLPLQCLFLLVFQRPLYLWMGASLAHDSTYLCCSVLFDKKDVYWS